ncbi:MAG: T9SS type A sorting domain-containing protein, partial [Pedobacter sp.]
PSENMVLGLSSKFTFLKHIVFDMDVSGSVYTRNVMLNPGNSFFINLQNTQIFYTNWLCERINTSGLMGQTVTLQIIMADCGGSAHWGYGYFDDFCGITCNQPAFNPTISLNPIGRACPTFPLPITGNISLPNNAFFTNVTIQVLDSSNNVVSSIINSSAPGGFFSTNLNYDNFYPNGYNINTDFNIRALLNYTINGVSQTPIIANNTNPPGPDVSFKNCTVPCREDWYFTTNQPIQTSTNFQASCCITSESLINPNLNVEFRAGYEINLKPNPNGTAGFYATSHQSGNFHAYIARCDESDSFSEAQKQSKTITERTSDESDIKIYPNPSTDKWNIQILHGSAKTTTVHLFDVLGKKVRNQTFSHDTHKLTVDNSDLAIGTYILQVTRDKVVKTYKLIKE